VYQEGGQRENRQPNSGRARVPRWARCEEPGCQHDGQMWCSEVSILADIERRAERRRIEAEREQLPSSKAGLTQKRSRIPRPDHLQVASVDFYPHVLDSTVLRPLERRIAEAALDQAREDDRVSNVPLSAMILAREWGLHPMTVSRAIESCAVKEVLHVSERGDFEGHVPMRVNLVGNRATMCSARRAWWAAQASATATVGVQTESDQSGVGAGKTRAERLASIAPDSSIAAGAPGTC
jgi:hypothetical protein